MSRILEVSGLSKHMGDSMALDGCSFSLESGRIVGLLGPNGAGKSTLLKTLAGVLRPDQGTVTLRGEPVTRRLRPRIAYMADHSLLPGEMKVETAVKWYRDLFPGASEPRLRQVAGGLPWDRKVSELSKGQAERLDLGMLLAREADVYLLDEPLGGVDPVERAHILNEVMAFLEEDRTVLMATHLVHDIEPILDDVLFLQGGRVILHEAAEEIRARYGRSVEEHYMAVFGGGTA